ncbi:MAG: hypothetical protein WCB68_12615, partial [Pyrinomonadaceae bacterium]
DVTRKAVQAQEESSPAPQALRFDLAEMAASSPENMRFLSSDQGVTPALQVHRTGDCSTQ